MKFVRDISLLVLLIIVTVMLIFMMSGGSSPQKIDYSQMLEDISKEGTVKSVVIERTDSGDKATLTYGKAGENQKEEKKYSYIPNMESFMKATEQYQKGAGNPEGVTMSVKPQSASSYWITLIPNIILIGIAIFIVVMFFRQAQGGGGKTMSFGKSRAKLQTDGKIKVTFEDVAGEDEEKEELTEIVDFLKNPQKYTKLGARIPKGVLLVGPPGTGKTLLAKAMAGEAGVPFFTISGSDFVEMFVGVGASRVRDLFEQAKKQSPCIIFIDEIDAVGRHRGAGLGGGHDEREQTLNQLLVEMDGFGINEGIIIIAATNRPDILDPALLRPGRFDRQVVVGLPDVKGREAVLEVHAKNKPLHEEVNLADIAKTTPGFTPADLANLLNEAALLAARRDKEQIGQDEIKEANFKVIMGPEKKSKVISDKEKKLTAYHEAGHAIAVKILSSTDHVDRISIIPAGLAGGYTAYKPEEDASYRTKRHLLETVCIALGGRAAEELVLGEISTGAASDLQTANRVARKMITSYGMSETLTNLIFENENNEVFLGKEFGHSNVYSQEVAAKIDNEVKSIIDECYNRIMEVLKHSIDALHRVAKVLLEKEKIEGDEFNALFNNEPYDDNEQKGREVVDNGPAGSEK